MLSRLFGADGTLDAISTELYGAIVALARQPRLYRELSVPDTVAGRFEMIVLHVVIIIDRLHRGSERERDIGQRLFEVFCTDMDETLREFGVSDVVMGKRMKGMAQSFYGRQDVYVEVLKSGDRDELSVALGRNLHPNQDLSASKALADYVMAMAHRVDAVGDGDFESGKAVFNDAGSEVAR